MQNQTPKKASRAGDLEINLTASDPLDRLKEFCDQGNYVSRFNWDKFKNGVMCELEVSYTIETMRGEMKKFLPKEVRFVFSEDVNYSKRVVAAIFLDRLGLGEEPQPEEERPLGPFATFLDAGTSKLQGFFQTETGDASDAMQNFAMSALGNLVGRVTDLMDEEGDEPLESEPNPDPEEIFSASRDTGATFGTINKVEVPVDKPKVSPCVLTPVIILKRPVADSSKDPRNEIPIPTVKSMPMSKVETRTKSWADVVATAGSKNSSLQPASVGIYDSTGKIIPGTETLVPGSEGYKFLSGK